MSRKLGTLIRLARSPERQGYLYLLLGLLCLLVLYPLMNDLVVGRLVMDVFLVGVLITGVVAVAHRRLQLVLTIVLSVVTILGGWAHTYLYSVGWLLLLSLSAAVLFFGNVATILLWDIFSEKKRVTVGLLYGAISVYLLVGVMFAFGYGLIEIVQPGAFEGAKLSENIDERTLVFIYFSFVTITTLGFGDISPATPQAGAFVYLEAIFGQMYLTILVARLVGMHISQAHD